MNGRTIAEDMQSRQDLKDAAASNLGHMLFELSRLELTLGLCIAWFDGGAECIYQRSGSQSVHRVT